MALDRSGARGTTDGLRRDRVRGVPLNGHTINGTPGRFMGFVTAQPTTFEGYQVGDLVIDATTAHTYLLRFLVGFGLVWVDGPSNIAESTVTGLVADLAKAGILALTNYDPAGLVTFTLTVTPKTKLDTTNLTLTFVAPPSGKVLVEVNAVGRCSTQGTTVAQAVYLQLVDHGTTTQRGNDSRLWDEQWNATAGFTSETVSVRGTCLFYLTGLTPGASFTVDLAAYCLTVTTASAAIFVGGGAGSMGAITMKAIAAP